MVGADEPRPTEKLILVDVDRGTILARLAARDGIVLRARDEEQERRQPSNHGVMSVSVILSARALTACDLRFSPDFDAPIVTMPAGTFIT